MQSRNSVVIFLSLRVLHSLSDLVKISLFEDPQIQLMCELTRKFSGMVGRLRPDHPGEFVGFSDLFEPRSGADKSLDTTLVG